MYELQFWCIKENIDTCNNNQKSKINTEVNACLCIETSPENASRQSDLPHSKKQKILGLHRSAGLLPVVCPTRVKKTALYMGISRSGAAGLIRAASPGPIAGSCACAEPRRYPDHTAHARQWKLRACADTGPGGETRQRQRTGCRDGEEGNPNGSPMPPSIAAHPVKESNRVCGAVPWKPPGVMGSLVHARPSTKGAMPYITTGGQKSQYTKQH